MTVNVIDVMRFESWGCLIFDCDFYNFMVGLIAVLGIDYWGQEHEVEAKAEANSHDRGQ